MPPMLCFSHGGASGQEFSSVAEAWSSFTAHPITIRRCSRGDPPGSQGKASAVRWGPRCARRHPGPRTPGVSGRFSPAPCSQVLVCKAPPTGLPNSPARNNLSVPGTSSVTAYLQLSDGPSPRPVPEAHARLLRGTTS